MKNYIDHEDNECKEESEVENIETIGGVDAKEEVSRWVCCNQSELWMGYHWNIMENCACTKLL